MAFKLSFTPIPETQLTFVNVPMVPVRTRKGETRYLCATWGGAMHLFDRRGREKVIAYPQGGQGSYSFVPALEDGFAWAVHTGGIITRIDVDKGEYDFVERAPLAAINWGAAMTLDGYLVCESSGGNPPQGEVMVYDTKKRRVAHMIAPISKLGNLYAHNIRAAADGCVVIPIATPGAELIRLDPRSGKYESFLPRAVQPQLIGEHAFRRSMTFLPDGRLALPHKSAIDTVSYPDFRDADPLPYPDAREGWQVIRDHGDGAIFAYRDGGGPPFDSLRAVSNVERLFVLDRSCRWRTYLEKFSPKLGNAEMSMFCALPRRRLLGLSFFGELAQYDRDGSAKLVKQLRNVGRQRFNYLQPTDGSLVFTTTFINMSFQEMDYRTGKGRNIRPCQVHGGQPAGTAWHGGRFWLACYGGAEITVYDPKAAGDWPVNPRHVLDIGHEQMRPQGMQTDGRYLWTATHAQYGKLGGALVRVDPQTETCKVWRNLVQDLNPTGLKVDAARRRVYVGATVDADCQSAPRAKGPAAVIAFDMDRLAPAWIARPEQDARSAVIMALPTNGLVLVAVYPGYPEALHLMDAATGETRRRFDPKLPKAWTDGECSFLVGGDGKLYFACVAGLFRYDPDGGPGEKVLDGPITKPMARGRDLFFIRGYDLGVAEGIFA